ncbi:MAG: ATP-binding cassette domain-containing protein [Lachnospiraceae bacterium]|nr:ATP-binding cassette domain-containing protein [Lachnospiraceae bacterium]
MRLEAKNISFRYGRREPWVIQNFNFSVEQGTCVGLSAPSGAGKSTLAMLLAGYLTPEEGGILLDGKPLPKKGICPVQLIYQHPEHAVNPRWRLRKVLEESGRIPEKLLVSLGIEREWLERFPRELSGGELQRFCVARALMSDARFLICDEISTMLDVITQAQIWRVVCSEAKKRGMGIVVITHNHHLAGRLCSQVYDLHGDQRSGDIV